jgi:hypothetical protein
MRVDICRFIVCAVIYIGAVVATASPALGQACDDGTVGNPSGWQCTTCSGSDPTQNISCSSTATVNDYLRCDQSSWKAGVVASAKFSVFGLGKCANAAAGHPPDCLPTVYTSPSSSGTQNAQQGLPGSSGSSDGPW